MTDKQLLQQFNAPKGAKLEKVFKNGNIQISTRVICDRCGNKEGIFYIGVHNGQLVPSHVDQGVCFKCHGRGYVIGKQILMTPENQAKHDREIEKKRQKAEEEAKKREEQIRAEEERRQKEKEAAEAAEKARKAISQFVGKIGEKIDTTLTLKFSAHFEVPSFRGFGTDTMYVHNFVDDLGNVYVWKTSTSVYMKIKDMIGGDDFLVAEKGDRVHLKGTIKDHTEYKDEKQTVLTRCRIQGIYGSKQEPKNEPKNEPEKPVERNNTGYYMEVLDMLYE